jgi:hypothetical protein
MKIKDNRVGGSSSQLKEIPVDCWIFYGLGPFIE